MAKRSRIGSRRSARLGASALGSAPEESVDTVIGQLPRRFLGPHDPADDIAPCGLVKRRLGEIGAMKQGHHAVTDIEDVIHAMTDENDADTLVLQPLDQV